MNTEQSLEEQITDLRESCIHAHELDHPQFIGKIAAFIRERDLNIATEAFNAGFKVCGEYEAGWDKNPSKTKQQFLSQYNSKTDECT